MSYTASDSEERPCAVKPRNTLFGCTAGIVFVCALVCSDVVLSDTALRGFNASVKDLYDCQQDAEQGDCKSLQDAADAGATLIRLNFSKLPLIDQAPPYARDPSGHALKAMYSLIDEASRLGLKVVIDPHAVTGAAKHTTLQRTDDFWTSAAAQDAWVDLWRDLAGDLKQRYGNDPTIFAFDLLNEPYDLPEDRSFDLNAFYTRLVRTIRQQDADRHLILDFYYQHYHEDPVQAALFRPLAPRQYDAGDQGLQGNARGDGRLLFSSHMYWPLTYTHQGIFVPRTDGGTRFEAGQRWPDDTRFSNRAAWHRGGLVKRLSGLRKFAEVHGHWRMFIGEFSASFCENCAWDTTGWTTPTQGADRYLTDLVRIFDGYGWHWAYHSLNGANYWDAGTPALRWGHLGYLLANPSDASNQWCSAS